MENEKTMYQKAEVGEILWREFYDDKARNKGYENWDDFMNKTKNKSRFMKSNKINQEDKI